MNTPTKHLLALAILLTPAVAQAQEGPLQVLFLGDRGHHQPAQRFAELAPALAQRGIELSYTEDLARLSPEGLVQFDALCVYANIDLLPEENERSLVKWVEAGGGLVALHCASYCFQNSDAWIELVGARFLRHGSGVFRTTVVDREHPVTRGYLSFESFDETYVHGRHNPDRRVLEVRQDAEGAEPYTWVREVGRGRVFYTAWGHDQRTFTSEGFQELVTRGTRWAAHADPPLPELVTPKVFAARVPNYRQRTEDATMVAALEPEESLQYAATAAGTQLELFAAEPQIASPLAMTWDDRGRLFLAESVDYPNDRQAPGQGHDRILLLEDTDGDGRADRFQVFADHLSLPTSLLWVDGGLLVHQPPSTLFLRDTDGDDIADERRVILEGWGTGDTHAGPSNLRYGFDNWIWGTVGYASFQGRVGGQEHSFGQAIYRFRPDGSQLEVLCTTSNNTWGLGISETGEVFDSTANNDQICYLALPNRMYESVRGWHGRGWSFIGDYRAFHPITKSVRQVDWHDAYTAAAGSALYTARAFPEPYWNSVALICEPTGHLVHLSRLEREGAGFVAHDGYNLFASGDEWCAPIAAEVGPDGAVWMIDWYSYVVQHNPTPSGFGTGAGSAYLTPHRDKQRARILRLSHRSAPACEARDLARASATELVATLDDSNLFWRLHAQRLLVEARDLAVVPALVARLQAPARSDGIGSDPGAIHALWALHGLGALEGEALAAVRGLLRHPSAAVRKNACRALSGDDGSGALLAERLEDADALVVREALVALTEAPSDEALGERLYRMLGEPSVAGDPWLADAATAAAARHDAGFLSAALALAPVREAVVERTEPVNLLPNASFEQGEGQLPAHWRPRTYSGRATHEWVREGRSGSHCLKIHSSEGADSSWFADVAVDPHGRYRLAGWVRTEGLAGRALGALFNVHTVGQTVTGAARGDSDWERFEVVFDADGRDSLSLNCLFGGWGRSTGTAWYDDVSLTQVEEPADLARLGAVRGAAVAVVTAHYAARGPAASIADTLERLSGADPGLVGFVLEGLARGWPPDGAAPELSAERVLALVELGRTLPAVGRADLAILLRKWGLGLRADALERSAIEALSALIEDDEQATSARLEAAARLVELRGELPARDALLELLQPAADPELVRGVIAIVREMRDEGTGRALLEHFEALTAEGRRGVIRACLRRDEWSLQLLDAIADGSVNHANLSAGLWQWLQRSENERIAQRASEVAGAAGQATSADRAAVYERLRPLAALAGDAERGKAVFQETCLVCHTFAGEGGQVGPALDGIGARGKAEVLLEIVDPNRSLESNYQLWLVRTLEGQLLSGRIVSESRTSFELCDSAGELSIIQREDVDEMAAQGISIMPEGLIDAFSEEQVRDLLEYVGRVAKEH